MMTMMEMQMKAELPAWMPVGSERPPHAKIVATLGPASDSPEVIGRLVEAGVSVFRFNFSHGDEAEMDRRLAMVRSVTDLGGRPIAILGDLQGPKIRVRDVPDFHEGGGIVVEAGQDVWFRQGMHDAEMIDGEPVFGTSFDPVFHDVDPGHRVLVNDGAIRMLAVERKDGQWLRCRVVVGGRITSRKGINLPDSELQVPAITDRDWACVDWAVKNRLDYLALSFVRTAEEVRALKDRLASLCTVENMHAQGGVLPQIPVISKVEKPQALVNLEEIIEASDGIMVARGDLGVEMDAAQVPVAQKTIIRMCQQLGKPVIVATQMLESMIESHTPTRAEASDVANAVFDGADAVMLSGETAVGHDPVLVVETMRRIIQVSESCSESMGCTDRPKSKLSNTIRRSPAIAHGAWHMAQELEAAVVVVWSQRGGMARYLSQQAFGMPILACTTSELAARRMALIGGVMPLRMDPPASGALADWTDLIEAFLIEHGLARPGDSALMIAGKPLGCVDAQDVIAILRVGDPRSGFRPR